MKGQYENNNKRSTSTQASCAMGTLRHYIWRVTINLRRFCVGLVCSKQQPGTSKQPGKRTCSNTKIAEIVLPTETISKPKVERLTPEVAKVTESEPIVAQTAPETPTMSVSEQEAKEFIYMKESGNNPQAVNSIGCVGIGQDCNGQLIKECPDLSYSCEDAFFTRYAEARYGGWVQAYQAWLSKNWW